MLTEHFFNHHPNQNNLHSQAHKKYTAQCKQAHVHKFHAHTQNSVARLQTDINFWVKRSSYRQHPVPNKYSNTVQLYTNMPNFPQDFWQQGANYFEKNRFCLMTAATQMHLPWSQHQGRALHFRYFNSIQSSIFNVIYLFMVGGSLLGFSAVRCSSSRAKRGI